MKRQIPLCSKITKFVSHNYLSLILQNQLEHQNLSKCDCRYLLRRPRRSDSDGRIFNIEKIYLLDFYLYYLNEIPYTRTTNFVIWWRTNLCPKNMMVTGCLQSKNVTNFFCFFFFSLFYLWKNLGDPSPSSILSN